MCQWSDAVILVAVEHMPPRRIMWHYHPERTVCGNQIEDPIHCIHQAQASCCWFSLLLSYYASCPRKYTVVLSYLIWLIWLTQIIFDIGSLADKAVSFLSGCCSVGGQGQKKEGRVWWTWDGQGRNRWCCVAGETIATASSTVFSHLPSIDGLLISSYLFSIDVKLCLTWLTLTLGNLSSTDVKLCICIFFLYRWLLYYHIFLFISRN
jgi:hypothetical protein